MANRTTASAVKILLDSTLEDSIVVSFIDVANSLATEKLATDTTLGVERREQIERYLSAHLIASTIERMGQEEKIGEASIKYTGATGKGLEATSYGQMVKVLDTTGAFAQADKRVASIKAIKSFDT